MVLVDFLNFLEKLSLVGHDHLFNPGSIVDLLLEGPQNDEQVLDDGHGRLGENVLPRDVDLEFSDLSAFHFDR